MLAYETEKIRANIWHEYINTITDKLQELLHRPEHEKYKVYQKLINYHILVIGLCGVKSYTILVPPFKCINQFSDILLNDIKFNWQMSNDKFHELLEFINDKISLFEYTFNHKISQLRVNMDITIETSFSNSDVSMSVSDRHGSDKFSLKIAEYHKLKNLFDKQSDLFDVRLCTLLKRYSFYEQLMGLNLSANSIYDFIKNNGFEDTTLEMFAGPVNSNLKHYCSLFYDTDKYFSSLGNAFELGANINQYDILVANPPFTEIIIQKMADVIVHHLNKYKSMSIVIIPDWRNNNQYDLDKNIQITKNELTVKRSDAPYVGYQILRNSMHFKSVICNGNYKFFDYFKGVYRGIGINIVIVVLSNDHPLANDFINFFKKN